MKSIHTFSELLDALRSQGICSDITPNASTRSQLTIEEECKKLAHELMSYDQEVGDLLLLVSLWSRYRRNNIADNNDILQYMEWLLKNPNKTY